MREAKGGGDEGPAPLIEIENDNPQPEWDLTSLYGDMGLVKSEDSRPASLRTLPTLPHYMGEYEAKSEVRAIPY